MTFTQPGASIPRRTCLPLTLTTRMVVSSPMTMDSPTFRLKTSILLLREAIRGPVFNRNVRVKLAEGPFRFKGRYGEKSGHKPQK